MSYLLPFLLFSSKKVAGNFPQPPKQSTYLITSLFFLTAPLEERWAWAWGWSIATGTRAAGIYNTATKHLRLLFAVMSCYR
jgi:hypothetical protein